MLAELDALRALQRLGTTRAAAQSLRITQSAVSKRIDALEALTTYPLTEKTGRRVRLTPAAIRLLQTAEPLLLALQSALKQTPEALPGRISIAVSESLLSSWAAEILTQARARIPGLELELRAHRSLTCIERVRSGDCMLALVSGWGEAGTSLRSILIGTELMVLIPASLKRSKLDLRKPIDVLTIEPQSGTRQSLDRRLFKLKGAGGPDIRVKETLESFAAVVQLARAGYAHALAPQGIVDALGVPRAAQIPLSTSKGEKLTRPISLVGGAATLAQARIESFVEFLKAARKG